jgi:hypothetical protein
MRAAAWSGVAGASDLESARPLLRADEARFLARERLFTDDNVRRVLLNVLRVAGAQTQAGQRPWSRDETVGIVEGLYVTGLRLLNSGAPRAERRAGLRVVAGLLEAMEPLLPERPATSPDKPGFAAELVRVLDLASRDRDAREDGRTRGDAYTRLQRERRDAHDAADVSAFILKVNNGALMETSPAATRAAADGQLALPAIPLPPSLAPDGPAGMLVLPQTRVDARIYFAGRAPGSLLSRLYARSPAVMIGLYAAVTEFGRTLRAIKFVRDHAAVSRAEAAVMAAGVLFIYTAMIAAFATVLLTGLSYDVSPWLAVLAGLPAAAVSNIAAHGVFNLTRVAVATRKAPSRDHAIAEGLRAHAGGRASELERALPPVRDLLLRRADRRGLLTGLSSADVTRVAAELRSLGPVANVTVRDAQAAMKDEMFGGLPALGIAAVAGKKNVAVAADANDIAAMTALAAALGDNLLYILVADTDRGAFAALANRPNVRLLRADGGLSRAGDTRTVHLAALAGGLAALSASDRGNLLLALNDADVVDKDGLTPALENVLAPVRLALLDALLAVPVTRVQLNAVVDLAKLIAVQA